MNKMVQGKKYLITGASGLLGSSFCKLLVKSNSIVVGISHTHPHSVAGVRFVNMDLYDSDGLSALLNEVAPDVIIHCAGLTNVDLCETDRELAQYLHVDVTRQLARYTKVKAAKMVYISTDHLWPGNEQFVTEDSLPNPINNYGMTKYNGELAAQEENPESLIVRTNFYGAGLPWRFSFSDWIFGMLRDGKEINAFKDCYYTPILISRLSDVLLVLLEKEAKGIYNVVAKDRLSKYEFAIKIARVFGLDESLIKPGLLQDANLQAPRPLDMSLSTDKVSAFLGYEMASVDECLLELNEIMIKNENAR